MRGDQSFRVTEQIFSDTTDGKEGVSLQRRAKKCVGEMGKGKLQIKEEISLLRIASLWGPFVSDVSVSVFVGTRCILWTSLANDAPNFQISLSLGKIKLPSSEKCCSQTYGLHVYYVFVLKMDTFLLTAFSFFHSHSQFFHSDIF